MHHSTSLINTRRRRLFNHISYNNHAWMLRRYIFFVLRLSRHYRHLNCSFVLSFLFDWLDVCSSFSTDVPYSFYYFLLITISVIFINRRLQKICFWVNSLTTFTCFFICMINSKTRKKRKDGEKVCCPFEITLHK